MDATNIDIVSTFKSSGLTQDAFCRENGITLERLRYYLYKKKGCKNGPKTRTRRQKSSSPAFISFNQAEKTISKIDEGIKLNYTIIHGKFTSRDLITLVRDLAQTSC
jgi:hypothetical protein